MVGIAYSFIKLVKRKVIVKEILMAYFVFFMIIKLRPYVKAFVLPTSNMILLHLCFCSS